MSGSLVVGGTAQIAFASGAENAKGPFASACIFFAFTSACGCVDSTKPSYALARSTQLSGSFSSVEFDASQTRFEKRSFLGWQLDLCVHVFAPCSKTLQLSVDYSRSDIRLLLTGEHVRTAAEQSALDQELTRRRLEREQQDIGGGGSIARPQSFGSGWRLLLCVLVGRGVLTLSLSHRSIPSAGSHSRHRFVADSVSDGIGVC